MDSPKAKSEADATLITRFPDLQLIGCSLSPGVADLGEQSEGEFTGE
jgi:hypothetical protein